MEDSSNSNIFPQDKMEGIVNIPQEPSYEGVTHNDNHDDNHDGNSGSNGGVVEAKHGRNHPHSGSNDTAAAERQIREERVAVYCETTSRLEEILNGIKGTTKHLLREIDIYAEAMESVSVDYLRCQNSQRKEARRLEEVEPDVAGATSHFLQQA